MFCFPKFPNGTECVLCECPCVAAGDLQIDEADFRDDGLGVLPQEEAIPSLRVRGCAGAGASWLIRLGCLNLYILAL